MAFRLNERKLLQEALESVPPDDSERLAGRWVGGRALRPQGTHAGMSRPQLPFRCEFFTVSLGFLLLLQLKLSALPCLTCTWTKCLNFWLHPLKRLTT